MSLWPCVYVSRLNFEQQKSLARGKHSVHINARMPTQRRNFVSTERNDLSWSRLAWRLRTQLHHHFHRYSRLLNYRKTHKEKYGHKWPVMLSLSTWWPITTYCPTLIFFATLLKTRQWIAVSHSLPTDYQFFKLSFNTRSVIQRLPKVTVQVELNYAFTFYIHIYLTYKIFRSVIEYLIIQSHLTDK